MTWEWAVLLSILAICGTVIYLKKQPNLAEDFQLQKDHSDRCFEIQGNQILDLIRDKEDLKKQIEVASKLIADHQKAISQANFATAFSRHLPKGL